MGTGAGTEIEWAASGGRAGQGRTASDGRVGQERTASDGRVGQERTASDGRVGQGRTASDGRVGQIDTVNTDVSDRDRRRWTSVPETEEMKERE
jgi:hypothetical protein